MEDQLAPLGAHLELLIIRLQQNKMAVPFHEDLRQLLAVLRFLRHRKLNALQKNYQCRQSLLAVYYVIYGIGLPPTDLVSGVRKQTMVAMKWC